MSDIEKTYNLLNKYFKKDGNGNIDDIIKKSNVKHFNLKENIYLSVVCTVNDRSSQTLYTLKSYNYIASLNKINIQIIIVEDTVNKNLRLPLDLNFSNLEITYVFINEKTWINPCLNYNIGFEFIKSDNVILTNSEVCVFGNIYNVIKNKLTENNYLVFDVFEFRDHCKTNYNSELWKKCEDFNYHNIDNNFKDIKKHYLQSINNNRNLHFLTAIHKKSLLKIKGFDKELSLDYNRDDIMFLVQIKDVLKLKIINCFEEKENIVGIHQWHKKYKYEPLHKNKKRTPNAILYRQKCKYLEKNNKYLNFMDFENFKDLIKEIQS